MSEFEIAQQVLSCLRQAAREAPQTALPMLKRLTRLVGGDGCRHPLEVDEARSAAFMAVCGYAKALHRGQPADRLWSLAVQATEHWQSLTRRPVYSSQLALGVAGWNTSAKPSMQ
ncbi:hypothetical protein HNR60_002306 [Rhodopseudomonas rhenobacensis]|uniref:Uncharacterized protein n=1 Tax=Rhodopseudomonas rhenobacensis TaxID=87461 RepID=A0A7W7Z415_9BRAD|nr:hypothetical protein [Rhodopseudomonas rhenobacensis]